MSELDELDLEETVDSTARSISPETPDDKAPAIWGARCGVLVGIADAGRTPLVMFPGQRGSAAVAARSTVDVHGSHVGREMVLMFEDGDPTRPIIVGCLARKDGQEVRTVPGQIEIEADGERCLVTAREQLVLRCGKATITLTKSGKVLIEGTYISSRSSGVNRIKGGSVQLN
jgi:hypothetical protein